MEYIEIKEGLRMPVVGLGTWRASPEEVTQAMVTALESGYRHFDTAFVYNNEEAIGKVLKEWIESGKVKRDDLFITTKLPAFGNRAKDVNRFLKMSLERLQLSYVDLYLIHMPFAFQLDEDSLSSAKNEDGTIKMDMENDNFAIWEEMEKAVENSLTKAIGLSNFNDEQIKAIHERAKIKPSVLQVEVHAYHQQYQLLKVCANLKIVVTAYAPLGSKGASEHFSTKYNYNFPEQPNLLEDETVKEVAKKYNKTPGQILLRHLLQMGVIIIPKSSNPGRIRQNIDLFNFKLAEDDIETIDRLDQGNAGRIFDFLFYRGVEQHPQYPFLRNIIRRRR